MKAATSTLGGLDWMIDDDIVQNKREKAIIVNDDDDEMKQKRRTVKDSGCHAVALVVGEYVPMPITQEDVAAIATATTTSRSDNTSNDTIGHNTVSRSQLDGIPVTATDEVSVLVVIQQDNAGTVKLESSNSHPDNTNGQDSNGAVTSRVTTNINMKKSRYDRYVDTNGVSPGAVCVQGINRSDDDSSAGASVIDEPSSEVNRPDLEHRQPSENVFMATGELAPMELWEMVEASPWVDPKTTRDNNQRDVSHDDTNPWLEIKRQRKQYSILLAIILIISVSLILGLVLPKTFRESTVNPVNTVNHVNQTKYKSFDTKEELVDAVNTFVSNPNITSLEETYGKIQDWNVSQIQDFSYLFSPFQGILWTSKFNEDLSRWDVSSANNMSYMFYGAQDFRGDISKWNVSRVTDMQFFMAQASKFDGNLSKWDTSQFVNTSHMFYSSPNFTGIGLENWNVGRVSDMTAMFASAEDCYAGSDLFHTYCIENKKFNRNLSSWDVSNVHCMASMFYFASSFQGVGIEDWDTSQVETMSFMFGHANSFDANLSKWDLSNVQNTRWMFTGATSFQGIGLEDWDTSNVQTMTGMFNEASSFDANLSKWNLSNVRDTFFMFAFGLLFQGVGIENWDTSQVETMSGMFGMASSFDANLSKWNLSNVNDTSYMFAGASSFQGLGVEDWDTSQLKTTSLMFYEASSFDANVSKWNLSNVQHTAHMFDSASSFQGVGVEDWDISKVETMSSMFRNASSFDANLASWDVTDVGDMSFMFQGATSFRGDGLEFWNVSHLHNTAFMFESATAFHGNLSNWDVSNVENATAMFLNATSFEGALWWNETSDTIMT